MQHNSSAFAVDSSSSRPTGQLGVVARLDDLVFLAVELRQSFQDHRPRRHVDSQRQRLGGEYQLHEPGNEQVFDRLFEGWHHSRMMSCHAPLEPTQPGGITEGTQVLAGQMLRQYRGTPSNLVSLRRRGELNARRRYRLRCLIAPRSREDEIDGG